MTPEQEKLIADILAQIVTACYKEMGREWCEAMLNEIDKIKHAGKS